MTDSASPTGGATPPDAGTSAGAGASGDGGVDEGFPYGRQAVADAFREFVAATPSGGTFYVTGSPGSGRSTLLTWLFLRSQTDQGDAGTSGPRTGPLFHAALGARGRGVDDLAVAIGGQLGYETATAAELLSVLAMDERPVCVAVGDLDEAGAVPDERHTTRLIESLLAPMAGLPNVRLVAEGAQKWAQHFDDCVIVDLDASDWTDRAAFDRYVAALCAYVPEPGPQSDGARPGALAHAISRAAYPNFLLAQLLVLDRVASEAEPEAAATDTPPTGIATATGADTGIDIGGAVARHLDRLSAESPVVADALYALALAGQAGLGRDLWRLATTAVAGRRIDRQEFAAAVELSWALLQPERAGSDGAGAPESRFALRHSAVATALLALRSQDAALQARRALVNSLAGQVPVAPADDGPPRPLWRRSDPALLSELLRQAAAVPGALGPLLGFPEVLLTTDLDGLRAVLDCSDEPAAAALRPALALLYPASRDQPARLQVAAVQHGLNDLAASVESACPPLPFRALRPPPAAPDVQESAQESPRGAVQEAVRSTVQEPAQGAVRGTVQGAPEVAVTETGAVEVGQRLGEETAALRWTLHGTPCTAARAELLDGVPVVAVADREGLLQVRSADDGRLLRPVVRADEPPELLCTLAGAPDPLSVCTAADRLWVVRLADGSTLAELRFGSNISAVRRTAGNELDVELGGFGIRLSFDPAVLRTLTGASSATGAAG
ncbi:hypothetical protein GCM10010211_44360 [Streptomyces albospinus]|uniref:ATP-binding protein n=1 Tax=Streptomyces albospinus TaxID=285515 RepID=A0ABQ2V9A5_9ACTN|nr:hypothetical protein [Streptomyces albospinus]GGU73526.1 hypothetical protein GCM10010211_44360 [Streptomyces albospinus]